MRHAYTFRSTRMMEQSMSELMQDWDIDRTSVIKLSLYLFTIHMKQSKVAHKDLYGLIRDIERLAPPEFPDYASFAD